MLNSDSMLKIWFEVMFHFISEFLGESVGEKFRGKDLTWLSFQEAVDRKKAIFPVHQRALRLSSSASLSRGLFGYYGTTFRAKW